MGAEGRPAVPGGAPFGKYFLLERIGAGGMAEVFLAVALGPEGFQRRMVIKRMLPSLSQDAAFVRMFVDEAKLCGLLSHPNLVQIFEFGSIDGSFFIAMEYVQGETLLAMQKKLAELGKVAPVSASLEIVRQVCHGLQYAHSLQSATGQPLGIIHRDVSPSNVMISAHGGVKILDFGIARVAEELRETRTQAGTMKGKVSYMSPEQIRMDEIDSRSDIFAIGIVLHELLTGRRLFRATNEYSSARMVLEHEVPRPSTLNPEVRPEIDAIVMRALERDLAARYQSAGEMAEDLEKLLLEMKASTHEPRRLLFSLFPQGASRSGEVQLPPGAGATPADSISVRTPSGSSRSMVSKVTRPISSGAVEAVEIDFVSDDQRARRRGRGRRRWALLGAAAGVAAAAVVLVNPPWRTVGQEPPVAPLSAQPAAPATPVPAAAAPAVKKSVEISLDSTPQEAEVIREDSGEVVGRTPLTLTLPQGREVLTFRFEKPGHAPTSYKVIPDLDKAVRAELAAAPVEEREEGPKPAAAPPRPTASRARGGRPARDARPAQAAEAPPAAGPDQPRACLLSVGSFPWAELWIDGKDTGQRTPVVHYPVTCGPHKVALRRRDLKLDHVTQVTVAPGHELKQHYDLSDEAGE